LSSALLVHTTFYLRHLRLKLGLDGGADVGYSLVETVCEIGVLRLT
jgi:hypothetical protein